ncbi:CHAT domain-containing protein [Ornithinimicrobium cerasi]|uniref:CHAT domain-containing protein n=1 Tax=Ornithinimicrobium cerasi TaxID=2248773 RepID=UPI001483A586|nr:CHAT domain-containing protein [Ornithinimicrobium cerasi]
MREADPVLLLGQGLAYGHEPVQRGGSHVRGHRHRGTFGHGAFNLKRETGVLLLEDEDGGGDGRPVEATEFLDLLRESQPMPRLIVLNSCSTAVTGSVNMFSSTAAVLVRGGVPAVAAMQFAISDAAAIAFTRGFYAAVAQGKRVDDAVTSAVGSPSELP